MNKPFVAIVGLFAAGVSVLAWYAATHSSLFVTNGLPVPVQVSLDGEEPVEVSPASFLALGSKSDGERTIEVRRGDVIIQRETLNLSTTTVFNVLGAAPIVVDEITYTSSNSMRTEPVRTYFCNLDSTSPKVAFLFEEPPTSISLPKGSNRDTRTVMRLASGGFFTCFEQGTLAQAATLMNKVSKAMPERRDLKELALSALAATDQHQQAVNEARALATAENTVDAHRLLQHMLVATGQRAEAVAEYKERHDREPTAESTYLWTRLLTPNEAVPVIRRALEQWPESTRLHRALAWNIDALALWSELLVETSWVLEHLEHDQPSEPWLRLQVRALVALGRADEALTALTESFPSSWDLDDVVTLDRVSRAAGRAPKPTAWERYRGDDTDTDGVNRFYFDTMTGRKPEHALPMSTGDGLDSVIALAGHNPTKALAAYRPRHSAASTPLTTEAAFLLVGEAWRTDAAVAISGLERALLMFGVLGELRDFVRTGRHLDGLNDLPGEHRASMWLARARALEAMGQLEDAKRARSEIAKADPLSGLARSASVEWPRVVPAKASGAFELRLLPNIVLSPSASK